MPPTRRVGGKSGLSTLSRPENKLDQNVARTGNLMYSLDMKKNAKAKNRRPQASKSSRPGYVEAMQELRRSSATSPIPSGKRYSRKPKHKEF